MRAGRDVREEVGTLSFTPASLFDGLAHPILSAHHSISHLKIGCCHPFREPLQFIVIAVMRGTFPDTYGLFCVTIKSWRVRGPSRHRHGEHHRRNALPKRITRYRDGHDAHDGHLRAYSREGVHLYFLGPYPFNLTRRTRRIEQGVPYLSDL